MKTLIFLLDLMFCMVIYATPSISESLPVNRILTIEKLANEAQAQLDIYSQRKSFEEERTRAALLKDQLQPQIKALMDDITKPADLYTLAIILYEGYPRFFTSLCDKIMWQAQDFV